MAVEDRALREKALNRFEDQLQGLKKQNLRIQAALVHTVETGEKIPEAPEQLLVGKNPGALFSGIIGWRSDIHTPTKSTFHYAGGESKELEVLANASAQNFIITDSQTNPINYEERQRIEDDFWHIAKDLGKQVWSDLPKLRKHGLWKMWQEIEPRYTDNFHGVWVDFVFELAWHASNSPLTAKKMVFWNGVTIELDSIEKIPKSFAEFTLADGTTPLSTPHQIPRPVPQWHSKIDDIVSASQYALDCLNVWIKLDAATEQNVSVEDKVEPSKPKNRKPKKPGRKPTADKIANDKLVAERWRSDAYPKIGRDDRVATAAAWLDKYSDMDFLTEGLKDPDDHEAVAKRIKNALDRHRRR